MCEIISKLVDPLNPYNKTIPYNKNAELTALIIKNFKLASIENSSLVIAIIATRGNDINSRLI